MKPTKLINIFEISCFFYCKKVERKGCVCMGIYGDDCNKTKKRKKEKKKKTRGNKKKEKSNK